MKPGLKMSELADASGVSAATIKHYLREGLLGRDGEIVRTSRNMAYYPPDFVERIKLIKRLQEERFMPLRLIREALEDDPARLQALVETEDRILEAAAAARSTMRSSSSMIARARCGSSSITPLITRSGMKRSSWRRLMRRMRSTKSGG